MKERDEIRREEVQEAVTEETALALPTTIVLPEKARVDEALDRAVYIASKLIETARKAGMTFTVRGRNGEQREGLTTDGWRLLASWCGFGVVCEVVSRDYAEDGTLVRVIARARLIRHGELIGQAEGSCHRHEAITTRQGEQYARWEDANEDTIESVAQSRAVAEVCKQNLGFVLRLAGFSQITETPAPKPVQTDEPPSAKDWARFWARARELGFDRESLHELYGVESMKEVIKTRQDMERILKEIAELTR
jgi:hypothetical protein